MSEVKQKKLLRASDISKKKFKTINTDGRFKEFLGEPEITGSWLLFGDSGNGKTTLILQLAEMLSQTKKVLYNPLEEGVSKTLQDALKNVKVKHRNFQICQKETYCEIVERIEKPRSPDVYLIDSIQYWTYSIDDYRPVNTKDIQKLFNNYPNKLFIFNSHREGKYPQGKTAKDLRYHSSVKILVENFKAYFLTRGVGTNIYHINTQWEQ
jgi:GTPase SAR1 family protein